MLILAGVTIATLLGDNSIIKRAQQAKNDTANATDKELAGIENLGNVIDEKLIRIEVKIKLTNGSTVTLTEANYGEYLGKAVKYTPASPSTDYGTSDKYRLFYIDFAGKYGEKGAVYLKADCDGKKTALTANDASGDSYAVMKALNPAWVQPETLQSNDKCVSWVLDPNEWNNWKDTTTEGIKDNINYVVGAPSLEMYVDSYNKYLECITQEVVFITGCLRLWLVVPSL